MYIVRVIKIEEFRNVILIELHSPLKLFLKSLRLRVYIILLKR